MPQKPYLGVAPSKTYQFMIILSPVGAYYKEGINPVKIAVENEFVRAVAGGTGNAKTAGNYAGSLKAQEDSKQSRVFPSTMVRWKRKKIH